ncbi:hypothetical protein GYMLUDRAFT_801070 [Collybiopsis luxurians FD-317 M1]|nr:hypothetical protein GYMLUDRAFT_801070 [Collybiopsis luxurians FD-317 M1]
MHEQLEEDPLNICEGFNATDETFPYASVADLRSARTDRDSLRTTKKDAAEREARLNLAIQLLYCQNEDLQNTLSDHRFYAECLRQKLKGWNYRSLSNLSRASPARTTTSHTHAPAIHSLTLPSAPSLSVEDASSNELSPNTSPSPNNIKKRSLPSAPEMTHPCPRPPEEKCEAHQPKRVKFCEDSIPNEGIPMLSSLQRLAIAN